MKLYSFGITILKIEIIYLIYLYCTRY